MNCMRIGRVSFQRNLPLKRKPLIGHMLQNQLLGCIRVDRTAFLVTLRLAGEGVTEECDSNKILVRVVLIREGEVHIDNSKMEITFQSYYSIGYFPPRIQIFRTLTPTLNLPLGTSQTDYVLYCDPTYQKLSNINENPMLRTGICWSMAW